MESPKVRCICLCELVNRNSFCVQPNPTQLSYPQGAGPRQALPYHTWISASSDPNATTRIQHNPTLDAGPVSSRETPARCCSVALAASLSPRYDLPDLTINFWHSVFVRAVKKDGATSRVFWRTYVRIGAESRSRCSPCIVPDAILDQRHPKWITRIVDSSLFAHCFFSPRTPLP